MTRLKIAQKRNWLKFRLAGMSIGNLAEDGFTTQIEREILNQMDDLKKKLLTNWDKSSIELGMRPRYAYEERIKKLKNNINSELLGIPRTKNQ